MSRTPSMSVQQAESILGPRGHLLVDSDNRSTVRKWLVANGYPSAFANDCTTRELQNAYNEINGEGIAVLNRKLKLAQEADDMNPRVPGNVAVAAAMQSPDGMAPQARVPYVAPHVVDDALVARMAPPATPANAHDTTAIGLLRELILNGYKPGIDANEVRSIVQEQLAGIAPRVIEVRHPNKDAIRVEGLVHPEFERVVNYLNDGSHVMLVGPAGCGKSTLIKQVSKALATDCTILSGTAGATEGDVIGKLLPGDNGKWDYYPSEMVKLYERGNAVIGLDEIAGFDPNMLMIFNMPLANGHMYVHLRSAVKMNPLIESGERVFFLATDNTYGTGANPMYAGRNPMDEATRDRFIFITVDYDKRLEESIAAAGGLSAAEMAGIWELRDRCREAQLRRVISTRAFMKAATMKRCGDSWREIRDRLLEGWSKDEKSKVGV